MARRPTSRRTRHTAAVRPAVRPPSRAARAQATRGNARGKNLPAPAPASARRARRPRRAGAPSASCTTLGSDQRSSPSLASSSAPLVAGSGWAIVGGLGQRATTEDPPSAPLDDRDLEGGLGAGDHPEAQLGGPGKLDGEGEALVSSGDDLWCDSPAGDVESLSGVDARRHRRPPLVEVEAMGADAEPSPAERDGEQAKGRRQEPPHPRGSRADPVSFQTLLRRVQEASQPQRGVWASRRRSAFPVGEGRLGTREASWSARGGPRDVGGL